MATPHSTKIFEDYPFLASLPELTVTDHQREIIVAETDRFLNALPAWQESQARHEAAFYDNIPPSTLLGGHNPLVAMLDTYQSYLLLELAQEIKAGVRDLSRRYRTVQLRRSSRLKPTFAPTSSYTCSCSFVIKA